MNIIHNTNMTPPIYMYYSQSKIQNFVADKRTNERTDEMSKQYGPLTNIILGAQVALWAMRWPVELTVPGLIPAGGRNLFNRKRSYIAHTLS